MAVLFSGVLLYMSVLMGVLAVDQEVRVLLDFGLSFIELMAFAMAAFGAASGVLREMETKTIYLILSRPVPRAAFLSGRCLGLIGSTGAAVLAMVLVHLSLLWLKGWPGQWSYAAALYGIGLKLIIAVVVGILFSLLSTSTLSALTMTTIVWTLGHFIPEIEFLLPRGAGGPAAVFLQAGAYLLPNLQLLNFRDRLDAPPLAMPGGELFWIAAGYTLFYSTACFGLAYALFRKREF
ncbi:MAG: ABC transporter permease [Elusimicrobia bacterium]|nr:ABC transporter permease [Elusimicrobiota bacterium]